MISWFANHPTAANLLLILILAAGLISAPNLKRETFPDYEPVEANISIEYRGATAVDVEENICLRLINALSGVNHLEELTCRAQDNLADANAKMKPSGNSSQFLDDLRTEIDTIIDFPERARPPIIRERHRKDLVAAIAIHAQTSLPHLESYARQLEAKLRNINGVNDIELSGLSDRRWEIQVSRDQLQQHGLSIKDIAQTIQRQNIDLPIGTIETNDKEIQLRFVDQRRNVDALSSLPVIRSDSGAEITLGDIANISIRYERPEKRVDYNGHRAIVLEVFKNREDDALTVMADLRQFLREERIKKGDTIFLSITQDMTSLVEDRLQMLVKNGITGLALVALVMSLFFRPRLALWAIMGLPAAFAGAIIAMNLFGLSLNMITLVALLMAVGIVMDDSVVLTDQIVKQLKNTSSTLEAVTLGTRQILPGVLSSFLTTVAVFAPLSFLAGELGAVLQVLPVVLIAALTASLIEAFWILPHHLKQSAEHHDFTQDPLQAPGFYGSFHRGFERFKEKVGRTADLAIRRRYITAASLIVILLGSIGFIAGGNIQMEAMPDIDGDVLEARILMPQGTPLSRTEEVTQQVVEAIQQVENNKFKRADEKGLIEGIQVHFGQNASANESGPHVATVSVDLLTAEKRTVTLDELTSAWQEKIPTIYGLISLNIQEPGFGPAGIPIEIRLAGSNLNQLKQASIETQNTLKKYVGVYNVIDDLRPGKPQQQLSLTSGTYAKGFTAEEIANQLRTGLLGERLTTLQIGDQPVDLVVRQIQSERSRPDFLEQSIIISPKGSPIPLIELVDIKSVRQWGQITRINGDRTVTISADVDVQRNNAEAIIKDFKNNHASNILNKYPDINITYEGQVARSAETKQSIVRGLLIGLLGVFLILSYQFRSYIEPLIVMVSIPMAFLGAIWGHAIMGYNLSMPSLVGAASLAGIVVNNAILLIYFIKHYRDKEKLDIISAAGKASRARMRAIFISSSTTIAGLLPLLAETSTQAVAIIPLVIAVVFGLLTSTVLVLLVLPALYVILDDVGLVTPIVFKSSKQK
ncbi:efflux RND transporter permease subunit [Thiomicrospira sp. S5]|uniref:efflux RND transporter permease subunit n=1 Tax=Thiomicrospira sp. S5 TaxID=1803865 RepID=UPI0004A777DE|nr:efflux RND transporter permease subunit [Thiomicrospira sp. S5]AZR81299.1 acriflavin resistance protein [Thiomicrospira sp. S5]AZR81468.1 acriflavin resistance protein [Thiomicrospira sp. S5]